MAATRLLSGDTLVAVPAGLLAGVLSLVVIEAGVLAPPAGPRPNRPVAVTLPPPAPATQPVTPHEHPITVVAAAERPTSLAAVAESAGAFIR